MLCQIAKCIIEITILNMNNNILPFYNPTDKLVVKSNDCYQYDSDGKEYIDFESGVWCTNLGHSNDRIIEVVELQLKDSIHHCYRFRNRHAEALSEELLRITGIREGSSVFLSSGSEAVNLSITLACHITGRDKFLTIDNSYLSAYGPGRISLENKEKVIIPFNSRLHIKKINFNEIAAFVIETGGASVDMVRIPDYSFILDIIIQAKDTGCLLIADEVTTGMGRTGKWFGFQHYNFIPDMVVTGKALGNGYPVSAVTVNKEIANEFNKNPFRYAQSHQNDPLGCAVGLEVIKIIEENKMLDACQNTGNYFKEELEVLKGRHRDKIKEVRGRGLMLALELADAVDGSQMDKKLFDSGFIAGFKANTFRFLPPLTITTNDIDHLIRTIDSLLSNPLD
jgi:acetylornithine aminotransferase